ncbi:hypothetical protein BDW62DRAFT_204490 [Aspergillus aurantiobrunneus]
MRTGFYLLISSFDEEIDQYLGFIVGRLGRPLPEPWWSTSWKRRREYFQDKPDARGMAVRTKGSLYGEVEEDPLRYMVHDVQRHYVKRADGKPWDNDTLCKEEEDLFVDLLYSMLRYEPDQRPTAEHVLQHP